MDEVKSAAALEIVRKLAIAKAEEDRATERRISLEADLIDVLEFRKPEGQESYTIETPSASCKVVLKQPINASVDSDEWDRIRKTIDKKSPVHAIFVQQWKISTAEARALQEKDPATFAIAAPAITRRPGKVQVDIKQLVVA